MSRAMRLIAQPCRWRGMSNRYSALMRPSLENIADVTIALLPSEYHDDCKHNAIRRAKLASLLF